MTNVWSAFCLLSNRRPPSSEGVNPITFEQIKAWKELTEARIKPWEIEILLKLDDVYRKVASE